MVLERFEWKLKAKLAIETIIFKGNCDKILAYFGSKITKRGYDYFRGFFFSQSLSDIPGNNMTSVFLRD